MEDYIKIKDDWYGAKKGDILKWTGNTSSMGSPLMQFPKNRISTSALSPYASIAGLSYETATFDDWVEQEMNNVKLVLLKLGDYITVIEKGNPVMIGKVKTVNQNSDNHNIRGKADYISIFSEKGNKHLKLNETWCYQSDESPPRTFRTSTEEEKNWLLQCIKLNKFITLEEFQNKVDVLKETKTLFKFKIGDSVKIVPGGRECYDKDTSANFAESIPTDGASICGIIDSFFENDSIKWYKIKYTDSNTIYSNAVSEKGLQLYDSLLEEAKKKYPIGTVYNCAYSPEDFSNKTVIFELRYVDKEKNTIEGGRGYIYYKGRWANIIRKVDQKVDSKYPLVLSDLKENEIYVGCGKDEIETYLFKPRKAEISLSDKCYYSSNSPFGAGVKFRIATPDEKKWLEFCIKENKFFSKEAVLRKNPNTTYNFEPMGIYVGEWSSGKVLFRTFTGILDEKCELIYDIHKEKPLFEINIKGCCTAPNIDFREADTVEKQWLLACISKGRFIARDRFPNEDLIPGKWYKCLGNCYFKFKKFSSWNCMDAETIHLVYNSSNSVTNELWWENPTELKDLSEIQSFLPTGHVDKKEFKVGDWVIGWHRDEYLKNQAWQIGRISEKNFVYPIGVDLTWNTEMKNIRFATKEEIKRVPEKESELSSLPEKWCIKIINEEICNYVNKNGSYPPYGWPGNKGNYAHFPSIDGLTTCDIIESGYTQISYEEFKKWVLNKEKSMNKKEPILIDGEWYDVDLGKFGEWIYQYRPDGDKKLSNYKAVSKKSNAIFTYGYVSSNSDIVSIKKADMKEVHKYFPVTEVEWKPQIGEYVAMIKAGGWGYDPGNNGCIGKITEVKPGEAYGFKTYRINGEIINPNNGDKTFFDIPIRSETVTYCRKATDEEVKAVLGKVSEKLAFKDTSELYIKGIDPIGKDPKHFEVGSIIKGTLIKFEGQKEVQGMLYKEGPDYYLLHNDSSYNGIYPYEKPKEYKYSWRLSSSAEYSNNFVLIKSKTTKKTVFDEKEHLSKPINKKLEIKINKKVKQKTKLKL